MIRRLEAAALVLGLGLDAWLGSGLGLRALDLGCALRAVDSRRALRRWVPAELMLLPRKRRPTKVMPACAVNEDVGSVRMDPAFQNNA